MMTVNKLAQYFLLLLMVASPANSNLKVSVIVTESETSNNCPLWHYRSGKSVHVVGYIWEYRTAIQTVLLWIMATA